MTDMSEAPERIWARHVAEYGHDMLELGCWWPVPEYGDEVPYLRADLHAARVAELVGALRGLMYPSVDVIEATDHALAILAKYGGKADG